MGNRRITLKVEDNISYMRQTDLFDPVNQNLRIIVFGAGSLGSFITLNLAKLGFSEITVYDFDKVEKHNIPNQFYRVEDIGKYKVEALCGIIKSFADVKIGWSKEKVTKNTDIPHTLNTVYILTFDTLEQRKIIFDKLKELGSGMVLDVRVGGEQLDIQTVDLFEDDEIEKWKKSFDIIPNDLPCGARSIIYTVLNVASEVCNIVKKLNNEESYATKLVRHMKSYKIINSVKKVVEEID